MPFKGISFAFSSIEMERADDSSCIGRATISLDDDAGGGSEPSERDISALCSDISKTRIVDGRGGQVEAFCMAFCKLRISEENGRIPTTGTFCEKIRRHE